MKACTLIAAGLLLAAAATAHAQSIAVEKQPCIPQEDNGVVKATASLVPGQTPRLYFRWKDHEDFYWVAMEAEPGGRFWATPPKPEQRNEQVEIYGALVDSTGKIVARSESQIVKVTRDCPRLTEKERGVAENLTVGETSPKQEGKKVMAFLCDGVVTRINSAGIRRSDGVCRACVIALWQRMATLPVITGLTICVGGGECSPPEPSPARP